MEVNCTEPFLSVRVPWTNTIETEVLAVCERLMNELGTNCGCDWYKLFLVFFKI